jgi:hypothetical protein
MPCKLYTDSMRSTREWGIEKCACRKIALGHTADASADWRDSKIGAIYEGTSNIQLETIGKAIKKKCSWSCSLRSSAVLTLSTTDAA